MTKSKLEKVRDSQYKHTSPDTFYEDESGAIGFDVVASEFTGTAWVNMFVSGLSADSTMNYKTVWKTLYDEQLDDLITMMEFILKTHFPNYERKSS